MEGPRKLARSDPMTLGAILWHTKTGTSSSSSCVLTRASFAAAEGCIQTEIDHAGIGTRVGEVFRDWEVRVGKEYRDGRSRWIPERKLAQFRQDRS